MPIDPNIALGVRPVEQPNMLAQMGQVMALKAAQQEMEGYEGVKSALSGGMDASDPRLLQYGKRGIEAFKAAGEGKIKQLEAGKRQSELLGNIFGGVMQDPTSGPAAVDQLVKMGVIKPEEAQQVMAQAGNNPEAWKKIAAPYYQQSIDSTKRFQDETERWKAELQAKVTREGHGVQMAGHQMTAGAAANRLAFDKEKTAWERANPGYEIKESENGNMVGINKRTLEAFPVTLGGGVNRLATPEPAAAVPAAPAAVATPIPVQEGAAAAPQQLKGKGTALTEFQGKATGFAMRAEQANKDLASVESKGVNQPGVFKRVAESTPYFGEGLGTLANVTQSAEQQRVEQAQRNFVNAILRQESGAAINADEFANARKQYFPQPGDSKDVIEQKRANRELAIKSLEVSAGPGMKQAPKSSASSIDALLEKYK